MRTRKVTGALRRAVKFANNYRTELETVSEMADTVLKVTKRRRDLVRNRTRQIYINKRLKPNRYEYLQFARAKYYYLAKAIQNLSNNVIGLYLKVEERN